MKADLSRFFSALICSLALALGAVFCLVTAFGLPIEPERIVLFCLIAAAVFSFIFSLRRKWLAITLLGLSLAVFLILILWNADAFKDSIVTVFRLVQLSFITGFEVFSEIVQEPLPLDATATPVLSAAAALLALVTSLAAARAHRLWLPAILSLPFLVICLINVSNPPALMPFLLLMGAYALLVVTQTVRRRGDGQHAIVLKVAVPTALFVFALSLFFGPDSAGRPDWAENLRARFKAFSESHAIIQNGSDGSVRVVSPLVSQTLGVTAWDASYNSVDLTAVGPNPKNAAEVMEVFNWSDNVLYLRGASFAKYENNTWSALGDEAYEDSGVSEEIWLSHHQGTNAVHVKTRKRCAVMYLPYRPEELPEGGEPHYDAYIENTGYDTDYNCTASLLFPRQEISSDYTDFVYRTYTQVPEETREALAPILEKLNGGSSGSVTYSVQIEDGDGDGTVTFSVQDDDSDDSDSASGTYVLAPTPRSSINAVRELVQNAARYSRDTPAMPEGEDFVRWFLEDSETGYCIHYATAAAILLRCEGIPARLVTGYMFTPTVNEWSTVTQSNAHAWVEIFSGGQGWIPVEVTPPESAPAPSGAGSSEQEDEHGGKPSPSPSVSPSPGIRPSPTPAQHPDEREHTSVEEEKAPFLMPGIVWILAALSAMLLGWRPVSKRVRTSLFSRADPNTRAVRMYRHLARMSRLSGLPIPEEGERLGLRARFSSHTITDEELGSLSLCIREQEEKLKAVDPAGKRMFLRFIFSA